MPTTLFEKSAPGRRALSWPEAYTRNADPETLSDIIPADLQRKRTLDWPELSQPDIARHFTALSHRNFCIDSHFYPLGSCTMKHNPRVNETVAMTEGFRWAHPLQRDEEIQGTLSILWELGEMLKSLTGMPGVTLQPCAGASGEWTGLMLFRAAFKARGELAQRKTIICPDSAHGTNPASAIRAGFQVKQIPSNKRGRADIDALKKELGPDTAGIMITNPNTLGLFEDQIAEISAAVRAAGGFVYMDGANYNAIAGQARPGDFGVDAMHINVHKTFSTPHGGGGPGAGPVVCSAPLVPYLPLPRILRNPDGTYSRQETDPLSIGRVRSFIANTAVLLRAWAYIRVLGLDGVREMSAVALLNANYLLSRLSGAYDVPYGDGKCMHEFVINATKQKNAGAKAMDIAKALLDRGFHPPTTYFPLVVPEALMMEPTETEPREILDRFADTMLELARLAADDPASVVDSPRTMPISRPDEVTAARKPILTWDAEAEATFGESAAATAGEPDAPMKSAH